ncbi:ribosome hibernation-promoting factor, HPF/YfiA family [Solilutibacter tolerans]|uniref:Ribosome hibernation promoting factor n=1 Tax=Solilutibacter tolerans TaxID=1604334 RepID=A0A1N6NIS1_9GAMM|nr:ribosome-associated translation inhibitor RaiA [Lysobacter tolerans]SIP91970.1 SSU ribosomal protein S30P /sigma 54 modulation protein [Lysobacter tolerans]
MQIDVHGQHIEITDALRTYSQDKMTRLERHFEHPLELRMQLSIDKPNHRAEGHLKVAGREYHADASAETMYAAIDLLTDKLDRVLVKHKEKMVDHHRGENPARDGTFG